MNMALWCLVRGESLEFSSLSDALTGKLCVNVYTGSAMANTSMELILLYIRIRHDP